MCVYRDGKKDRVVSPKDKNCITPLIPGWLEGLKSQRKKVRMELSIAETSFTLLNTGG
jgi:hypothetical protein